MWDAITEAIRRNERFLLCTHRDPDADGVGSQLALARLLVRLGKKAVILNPDKLPQILQFMDPEGSITGFDQIPAAESARLLDEAQAIFFLDACLWKRLGDMGREVRARADKVFCIDHHPLESDLLPGSVAEESASSTGELVYELICSMDQPLDQRMAFWLYCAVVKDTGSFRFENTNEKVLRIAAHLCSYGVVPCEVYDFLFERNSKGSVFCLGKVLNTLRLAYDDRLACIHLTREMLETTGVAIEETETFVNAIRSIDPVQACLFFRELTDGKIKISFRSKSKEIDINNLAAAFGGGGHRRAAGAVVNGTLDQVIEEVVERAGEMFFSGPATAGS